MLYFGLALSALYWPGYTGATVQTSWVVLSLALPALALWREPVRSPLHWVVVGWAAIAALATLWALNRYDAVWGLWQVVLFALAFWLGSSRVLLRPLLLGFAIGVNISALVAISQAFGIHSVLTYNPAVPAGLYFNSMYAGEIFAIAIIAAYIYRLWWVIPLPLVALALSHSHAGWAAAALGIGLSHFRSLWLFGLVLLGLAVAFTFHIRPSDAERIQIWYAALTNLAWFGNGPGSFLSLWWQDSTTHAIYPEYAHNDFIQLAFEYGLLAIVPLALLIAPIFLLGEDGEPTLLWPLYMAFFFMAFVSFPLYTPLLSFFGALAAGRLSGDWGAVRESRRRCRLGIVSGLLDTQPIPNLIRGARFPLVSRT